MVEFLAKKEWVQEGDAKGKSARLGVKQKRVRSHLTQFVEVRSMSRY